MKKFVLFVAVMLASVMPAMADYTLRLVDTGTTSDASTAYSANVTSVFTDASNIVGEIASLTKVYPAMTGYGAKFGSSSAAGSLKFTLLQPTYVAAILKVAPYSATTAVTLRVNDMEFPVEPSADGGFTEITYSPSASFESMEITTTTNTCFYLASITLVEQGTTGGGTGGMGTTPSDCHVVSFPWEENFDAVQADGSSVLPCWDNSVVSGTANSSPWTLTSGNGLRSQCMRFDSYNTPDGVVSDLRSPDFTLTSGLALYLKYKNPEAGDFSVYIVTDTIETLLASGLTKQMEWAFPSFDLSNYAGRQVHFVFRGTSNYGYGDAYIYLDRVAVMPVGSQLDLTTDPDYMPHIGSGYTIAREIKVGHSVADSVPLSVSQLPAFPTATSSLPEVFSVTDVKMLDRDYNPTTILDSATSVLVNYVITAPAQQVYKGTLTVSAGSLSSDVPFTVTGVPNYEIIPQDGEYDASSYNRVLHLYTTPGQTLSYTLKYTYDGFTFEQIQAGFLKDGMPEGFSSSSPYQTGEQSGAFDLTFVSQTVGDYTADIRFEAHAGLCSSDVYESMTVYVHVTNEPMITGATEWDWGTVDYLYADTNNLTLQMLNIDTTAQITVSTYPAYKFMPGDYTVSEGKLTIPVCLSSTLYGGSVETELYVYLNGKEAHKVLLKADVREPQITYLTPSIEFGAMRASDFMVWDTVYISVHDVDRSQLNFGWKVLPQDTADHRMNPFGVGQSVVINDTLVACPVVCNPAATVSGEYDGRIYCVCGMYWPEIPCHVTVLPEPQFLLDSVIDFGTMNYYEEKTLGANIYMRYIDPKTTKMTSDDKENILTLGTPLRQYDTTKVDVMEYLPNYYPVTLKATQVGDIECVLTLTSAEGSVLTTVKVRAHVLEPELFFDEQMHDMGYAEQGGAYREDTIAVHVRHCSATEVEFNTVASELDTTDESGFGVGQQVVLNDSTVLVPVGVNAHFYTTMGTHYRNLRAICHQFAAELPLQATIIPAATIEVIPDTLDFGEVMYDAMPNAYSQLPLKVATTSLHQTEASIEGDSVFTINQTTFGPTESYFGNHLEEDAILYLNLNVQGEHNATLVLRGDSDKVVKRYPIYAYVAPRPVLYDTIRATICSNSSYTFYGEVYTEAGQYEHRIENKQLGDSVITLNLTVLSTATTELDATIIEPETYLFGGKALTEEGVYHDTLVTAAGCDSVVRLTLHVVPLCSEYVVVNAPDDVVYYGDSTEFAPVVSLTCPSRDAVIEWGMVRNYNPVSTGKVDVTNPVGYEMLQSAAMNEYQGDTLSSRFRYYIQDRTQYFYYLIWQCDSVKEMHLFRFEHVGQLNSIWVNYDAPKREQTITSDATISVDGGEPQTVTVAWYNTTDTLNPATGNFVHGQSYYAVVTTPMSDVLGANYYIDATTAIVWGEEQQPKALTDGQLRSPIYTMENVTWSFRLKDTQLAPDGQASLSACAEPSVSISGSSSVVLDWELSMDNQNWLTLTDTLGYNIDFDSYCTDIHFPATLLRAGTYYIRVRAQYGNEVFFSRAAEVVIKAGIVMNEEATQQTTITETGEEVATVQYVFDEIEEVGVLTLTNSTNEGSATTAVAITSNTVIELVGTNTMVSDEAGFESSGDLSFVGRVDSTQVDEYGQTIYAALDSMSIVSKRPLYAPGSGVKVTFNGVYMVLTVYGHEDDNLIPSRSAARAQMKRAYSIAHAALEAAGEESVISGFDEADFINCGIIEPEGAEYDEDNLELMDDGDPVYNCTIAPTDIPSDPMSTGMVKDEIHAEKRVVNYIIYIYRQGKIYTMLGQSVK